MKIKEQKTNKVKDVLVIIKNILFITMIIFTFLVSDKLATYILSLGLDKLSMSINILLILAIMIIINKGGK